MRILKVLEVLLSDQLKLTINYRSIYDETWSVWNGGSVPNKN